MKSTVLKSLALLLATASITTVAMPRAELSVVKQLLTSATVDLTTDSATLPLRMGYLKDGRKVWFVLTDSTDKASASQYGIVHAAQLAAARQAKSTRSATIDKDGTFTFGSGTVDFSPMHALTPGDAPNYFPPKAFTPGSMADSEYSPFVQIEGTDVIFNAPIVAFDVDASEISFCDGSVDHSRVHDRVTKICPKTMLVTLQLGHGFASGERVIYLSFDSNNALPATMESVTYTPATDDLKNSGASESLFGFANGDVGVKNPERQGFNSALAGEGSPLNILDGLSLMSSGYTPLWDINVAVWTDAAISSGQRHRLTSGDATRSASQMNLLTNPMGGKVGSLGLLVNCPVVGFIN